MLCTTLMPPFARAKLGCDSQEKGTKIEDNAGNSLPIHYCSSSTKAVKRVIFGSNQVESLSTFPI